MLGPGPHMYGRGKLTDFLKSTGSKLARLTYKVVSDPMMIAAWNLYREHASDTVKQIASAVMGEPVTELVEDAAKAVARFVKKKYGPPEEVEKEVTKAVVNTVVDGESVLDDRSYVREPTKGEGLRRMPAKYNGFGLSPASQATLSELLAADFQGSSISAKKRHARAKK